MPMAELNFAWLDTTLRDIRYGLRSLRRSPGFAVLGVLIMGLGIGANTAVFSVVNAVLLRPLPYRDPDRLVTLTTRLTNGPLPSGSDIVEQISIPNFRDWEKQSSSFEAMAYYGGREAPVMAEATAEYARVGQVGPGFFRVFVVEPLRLLVGELHHLAGTIREALIHVLAVSVAPFNTMNPRGPGASRESQWYYS